MKTEFATRWQGLSSLAMTIALVVAASIAVAAAARAASLFGTQLEVSASGLVFRGDLLRKVIPIAELRLDRARVVDLDREPGLRPTFKLHGVGLPRYRSGWYLLKDGEKALLALIPTRPAVYIPTTRGHAILVSPDRPAEFLEALRAPTAAVQLFPVENGR